MKKFTKLNETTVPDVSLTRIQEDALEQLKKATEGVVKELKKKWFDSEIDDLTWLEEKYFDETLKNLSEIVARKVKS
jgi:hypothetical protein